MPFPCGTKPLSSEVRRLIPAHIEERGSAFAQNDRNVTRSKMVTRWDAGDIGCGKLILELRKRVLDLNPDERLEVIARGGGAQVDIPAWCRTTGPVIASYRHLHRSS